MYVSDANIVASGTTATAGLAMTGMNTLFLVLTMLVLVIAGLTLVRLARSRPSFATTGPVETPARRRRHP